MDAKSFIKKNKEPFINTVISVVILAVILITFPWMYKTAGIYDDLTVFEIAILSAATIITFCIYIVSIWIQPVNKNISKALKIISEICACWGVLILLFNALRTWNGDMAGLILMLLICAVIYGGTMLVVYVANKLTKYRFADTLKVGVMSFASVNIGLTFIAAFQFIMGIIGLIVFIVTLTVTLRILSHVRI